MIHNYSKLYLKIFYHYNLIMIKNNLLQIYKINTIDTNLITNIILKLFKKYNIKSQIEKNLYLNLSKFNIISSNNKIRILIKEIIIRDFDSSIFLYINTILDENTGEKYEEKNKYYINISNINAILDFNTVYSKINIFEEKIIDTHNGLWLDMTICK